MRSLVLCCLVAGCDGLSGELDCLPGGPLVVHQLLARGGDPVIAVDFDTNLAMGFDSATNKWQVIEGTPHGNLWAVARDNSYLGMDEGGLYRSVDRVTWDQVGPPGAFSRSDGAILGATTD